MLLFFFCLRKVVVYMQENINAVNIENGTRAILVSLCTGDMTTEAVEVSLAELENLLETAGGTAAYTVVQNMDKPNPKTYIGSGKAQEIAKLAEDDGDISLVVFDNELSPSQIANLEELTGVRVIDRTMLILDIFALHAVTGEGKLQVEIACLRYTAPRLTGKGKDLSRLGGGIGTRGPGESQLESDRRHLKRRIAALEDELAEMERTRRTQRAARDKKSIKNAAIVGYTNSGKSTLLNHLTAAGILAENKLFATLDPTTRMLTTENGVEVLLTDTVGFIDRLPHHLVKAFKSTLDELKYADIIIHLTDGSEDIEEIQRKAAVTDSLIEELCGEAKPILRVYNKMDKAVAGQFVPAGVIEISAKTGMGIDAFLAKLEETVRGGRRNVVFCFPASAVGKASLLYGVAEVNSTDYNDDGSLTVTAYCEEKEVGRFAEYVKEVR